MHDLMIKMDETVQFWEEYQNFTVSISYYQNPNWISC